MNDARFLKGARHHEEEGEGLLEKPKGKAPHEILTEMKEI